MGIFLRIVLPFLVPFITFQVVKRIRPSRVGLATGVALGLVVNDLLLQLVSIALVSAYIPFVGI